VIPVSSSGDDVEGQHERIESFSKKLPSLSESFL